MIQGKPGATAALTFQKTLERYPHAPGDPDVHAALSAEIDRLREDCGEFYQVIGYLAAKAELFNDPQTVKALDNACAAAQGEPRPHADLLPFTADAKDQAP